MRLAGVTLQLSAAATCVGGCFDEELESHRLCRCKLWKYFCFAKFSASSCTLFWMDGSKADVIDRYIDPSPLHLHHSQLAFRFSPAGFCSLSWTPEWCLRWVEAPLHTYHSVAFNQKLFNQTCEAGCVFFTQCCAVLCCVYGYRLLYDAQILCY